MELRYLGFDQSRNARVFRFEVLTKGEPARRVDVTADLALFLRYRVGIQDGPTLCAGKLTSDLARSFEGEHVLTGDDLRAHSEAIAAAEEKRLAARRLSGRRSHAGSSDPSRAPVYGARDGFRREA
jgi:hypothetical protein